MTSVKKVVLAAALTITMGGIALSPAKAVTWDFSSPSGALGTTQNYSSTPGGFTATATGWLTMAGSPVFTTTGNLFGKNFGGDENGLGMQSPAGDTSGQNEIQANTSFVRVQLPTGSSDATATMGSTTSGEFFEIFRSTSATTGYASIGSFSTEGVPIALQSGCPLCTFFAFFGVGTPGGIPSNVLLSLMTANVAAVPIPGALVLFGSGLVGLVALGRRKRKQLEAAAA